jgi:hypothetical protein
MNNSEDVDNGTPGDNSEDYRNQFLLEMYRQMWANINRHILVVWQSVSVLLGTFAVFALVEKQIISLDFASTLVVIIAAWLVAHAIDANFWFNRNLAIVSNIERQFLRPNDLCLIHGYFKEHRKAGPLLDHLLVQASLGFAVCGAVLLYHFSQRVAPGLGSPWRNLQIERALPYVTAVLAIPMLIRWHRTQTQKYRDFQRDSPGVLVAEPTDCGVHPFHAGRKPTPHAGTTSPPVSGMSRPAPGM